MTYTEHLTAGLAAVWDCEPSEVQQRLATKRKRTGHNALEREDIAWTASRCNRLLRTITSRINILRRHAKLPAVERSASDSGSEIARQPSLRPTPTATRPRRSSCGKDPEWMPDVAGKQATRTYGGKAKLGKTKPCQSRAKANDHGLSTPFVKRLMTSDFTALPSEKRHKPENLPRRQLRLPVQASSANEEAQRNLVTAFTSALDATRAPTEPTRRGAPTLMAACLRKVPQYVELEVSELDEDEARAEDVTSELFSELESLSIRADGSWPGLRQVVRASCIFHVSNAIEEGLVSADRISELVDSCSRRGAVREAHLILQAWLDRHAAMSRQQLKFDHPALRKLLAFQQVQDATELYLRTLKELVANDWISADECLAPDRATLTMLTKALVRGPGREVALMFLETALLAEAKASTSVAEQSSARLASVLTAISLARADAGEAPADEGTSSTIHSAALSLLARPKPTSPSSILRTRAFVLASFLLSLSGPQSSKTALSLGPTIFTSALQDRAFGDSLVAFACATATNFQRLIDVDAATAVDNVTRGFVTAPAMLSDRATEKLQVLRIETALAFAHQTSVPVDPAFLDLDQRPMTSGHAATQLRTPREKSTSSGFRWENGLCEWIAFTPFSARVADDRAAHPSISGTDATGQPRRSSGRHRTERGTRTPSPCKPSGTLKPILKPSQAQDLMPSPDILAVRSPNIRMQSPINVHPPVKTGQDTLKPNAKALAVAHPAKLSRPGVKEVSPVQTLKRSHSAAALGAEPVRPRKVILHAVEVDELGVPTPAQKKKKVRSSTGSSALVKDRKPSVAAGAQRRSLPVRALADVVMSDDELGL